jgi:hypothetical protein
MCKDLLQIFWVFSLNIPGDYQEKKTQKNRTPIGVGISFLEMP